MYVGKLIWNRQRFLKDPTPGKTPGANEPNRNGSRRRVPELRILDDDLWQSVKERQRAVKRTTATTRDREPFPGTPASPNTSSRADQVRLLRVVAIR